VANLPAQVGTGADHSPVRRHVSEAAPTNENPFSQSKLTVVPVLYFWPTGIAGLISPLLGALSRSHCTAEKAKKGAYVRALLSGEQTAHRLKKQG